MTPLPAFAGMTGENGRERRQQADGMTAADGDDDSYWLAMTDAIRQKLAIDGKQTAAANGQRRFH